MLLAALALFAPLVASVPAQADGPAALARAVERGHVEQVVRLVDADPHLVNAPHGDGQERPLHRAVRHADARLVEVLLAAGADPNAATVSGMTPLFYARSRRIARLLLNGGADARRTDGGGENAVQRLFGGIIGFIGTSDEDRALGALLTDAGAPLDLKSAIALGRAADIRRLVLEERRDGPRTFDLYNALSTNRSDALDVLLELGPELDGAPPPSNVTNWSYPRSVARWAVDLGRFDDAWRLLAAGASLGSDDSLHSVDVVRGRAVEPGGPTFCDVLDVLVHSDHAGLVGHALDRGLPVRISDPAHVFFDRDWRIPRVFRAGVVGAADALEVLVARGAPFANEDGSFSATLGAAIGGHAELHDALVAAGAETDFAALCLLGRGDEALATLGADGPNRTDATFATVPLGWALLRGDEALVRRLLDLGADPNGDAHSTLPGLRVPVRRSRVGIPFPTGRGARTTRILPLTVAVERGRLDLAELLLDHGARADAEALRGLAIAEGERARTLFLRALDALDPLRERDWATGAIVALLWLGVCATEADSGVPCSVDPGKAQVPPHGEPWGAVLQRRPEPRRAVLPDSVLWRRLLEPERTIDRDARMRALLDRRPLLHPEGPRLRAPFDAVSESTASRLVELGCVESAITRYGRTGDATEVLERAPIEWRIPEHNHLVERAIDRRDRTVLEHVLDPTLGIGAQKCRDFAVRAERVDWEEGLDILIARGFIDASFEKRSLGRRLLDHATSPERVAELLDQGADPNATDERGRTALHLAVDRGNGDVEAARLLLAAGADPDRRNDDAATALDDVVHAARSDLTHVDPALLSLMARSGADLDREGAWTFSETLRAQLLDLTEDTELKAFLERRPQPARAR